MSAVPPQVLVGVDGSDRYHDIHASPGSGSDVLRLRVPTSPAGLAQLLDQLETRWPGAVRAFGFEDPTSPFALALLARGERVYSTNPHALMNLRKGLNPSGKKDDPEDARACYVFLRENLDQLTPVTPSSDAGALLQARVLERLELIREKTRLLNRLTALFKATYPVILQTFSQLDQDLTLAFVARWPSPAALTELTLPTFTAFLREQRYPRSQAAAALWQRLQVTQLPLPDGVERLHGAHRQRLLEQLQLLRAQLRTLEKEIEQLFADHPDARIFASLPGGGEVLAPALLAVFGDDRKAWQSVAHLAAHCGTVPVTHRSGQKKSCHFRFHCDRDRRYLLHLFANASRRKCPWAQAFYRGQRQKGKSHATALRNLATKWLRILWRMWHDGKPYCPEQVKQGRGEPAEANASVTSPLTST